VVGGCGVIGGPILEERVFAAGPKGLVRSFHEVGGGYVCSRRGGGVHDKREACEACLQGEGEVCQVVNRQVFSHRWRGNFCPPVKGEVHREEASCDVPGRVLGSEGG